MDVNNNTQHEWLHLVNPVMTIERTLKFTPLAQKLFQLGIRPSRVATTTLTQPYK